jgi:membrane protease YdiL (CAAX protease family)
MSRTAVRALVALLIGATVVVWLLLDSLAWPARALTTFLVAPLPALTLLQARLVRRIPEDAEREAIYVSSAASIWILAALAMLASRFSGFSRLDLRVVPLSTGSLLIAAALTTCAGLALIAAGHLARVSESALVDFLIPASTAEKIAFTGLSVSAGIGEELVFRSFLIAAVYRATGSLPAAVSVSVAVFAIAHAYQGVSGVIRVALLGLVLTAPYLLTGSVYPSMVAHTTLDLVAGLFLGDWLRNHGDRV